jgi:hypothetical protein
LASVESALALVPPSVSSIFVIVAIVSAPNRSSFSGVCWRHESKLARWLSIADR